MDRLCVLGRWPVTHLTLIPWLDPEAIINTVGPWALLVVCLIVFAETALLIGFVFPGDSLLLVTGVFVFGGVIQAHLWSRSVLPSRRLSVAKSATRSVASPGHESSSQDEGIFLGQRPWNVRTRSSRAGELSLWSSPGSCR